MPFNNFPILTTSIENVATGGYALRITPGAGGLLGGNNVNCGLFWPRGASLGKFSWESWSIPLGGAFYERSDGHGGSHALLDGWDAGPDDLAVSGNIWPNPGSGSGSVVSFSSIDRIPAGTLHHRLICWDLSTIYVFLDGVLSGTFAHTGDRGNAGGAEDGMLYIGGSDHSNFDGWLFRMRGYEEDVPFESIPLGVFSPEWFFKSQHGTAGGDVKQASFNMDFTTPQYRIPDTSLGYNGSTHPGVLSVGNDYAVFTDAQHRSTAFPMFERKPFEQSAYAGPAPSPTPDSAILFDEFRRQDITPAWYDAANRPNNVAPTGQTWSSQTGIIGGKAYMWSNSGDKMMISAGTPDLDITFTNGNTAKKLSYNIRGDALNPTNYITVTTSLVLGLYDIVVAKVGSGAGTIDTAVGALANENFSTIRIVADGADIDIYIDGVLKLSTTTSYLTGNFVGVSGDPLNRLAKVSATTV